MPEQHPSLTQLLEKEDLEKFVQPYFKDREIYLSLVRKHGSPLWVLDAFG